MSEMIEYTPEPPVSENDEPVRKAVKHTVRLIYEMKKFREEQGDPMTAAQLLLEFTNPASIDFLVAQTKGEPCK